MKSTSVILPFALGASFPLSGADVFKADNGDQLVNDSSWTTTAPTASDVAVFDDTFTQTGNLGTGAALDYLGIRVAGTTVTRQSRSTSMRRILRFTPKSHTTT